MYKQDTSYELLLSIIGLIAIIVLISMASSCHLSANRSEHNMTVIEDGYCYDNNTHIIYIESITGRLQDMPVYTIYVNENGNYCLYEPETNKWIELKDDKNN